MRYKDKSAGWFAHFDDLVFTARGSLIEILIGEAVLAERPVRFPDMPKRAQKLAGMGYQLERATVFSNVRKIDERLNLAKERKSHNAIRHPSPGCSVRGET